MNEMLILCAIALVGIVLHITLKKDMPAIAFLLIVVTGFVVLVQALTPVMSVITEIQSIVSQVGMEAAQYLPVLKAVGIAVLVKVVGAICKDTGQSALAVKLEMVGGVLGFAVLLPLFQQVLSIISGWNR